MALVPVKDETKMKTCSENENQLLETLKQDC